MKNKKVVKFGMHKPSICAMIFVLIVFTLMYLLCLYYGNDISVQASTNVNSHDVDKIKIFCDVISNFSLVVISVLASTLISVPLIELRNKNNFINELIVNDVFSSEEFYNILSEENKQKILDTIEKEKNFNGDKNKVLLFENIRNKVNNELTKSGLFYEECSFLITCNIRENYIEKTIVKTFRLMTFSRPHPIREFILCSGKFKEIPGENNCECKSLLVNKEDWTKYINIRPGTAQEASDKKCDYNASRDYVCTRVLDVSNKKPINIEFTYTTKVPLNDLTYVCRMRYPCKKTSFKYKISGENASDYLINAPSFGFIDDAENTPNHKNNDPEIFKEFNDWIFPNDGIAVTMIKK